MRIERNNKEFIYTTPDELMMLAHKMEELWSKAEVGESLVVAVNGDESTELEIVIDQSRMSHPKLIPAATNREPLNHEPQKDSVPNVGETAREFADLMEKRNYTLREVGVVLDLIRSYTQNSRFVISKK